MTMPYNHYFSLLRMDCPREPGYFVKFEGDVLLLLLRFESESRREREGDASRERERASLRFGSVRVVLMLSPLRS